MWPPDKRVVRPAVCQRPVGTSPTVLDDLARWRPARCSGCRRCRVWVPGGQWRPLFDSVAFLYVMARTEKLNILGRY